MPNDYLMDCHRHITRELDRAVTHKHQAEHRNDPHRVAFHTGQIEELLNLRAFMSDRFNLTTQRYF